jgi:hypothetical protein
MLRPLTSHTPMAVMLWEYLYLYLFFCTAHILTQPNKYAFYLYCSGQYHDSGDKRNQQSQTLLNLSSPNVAWWCIITRPTKLLQGQGHRVQKCCPINSPFYTFFQFSPTFLRMVTTAVYMVNRAKYPLSFDTSLVDLTSRSRSQGTLKVGLYMYFEVTLNLTYGR